MKANVKTSLILALAIASVLPYQRSLADGSNDDPVSIVELYSYEETYDLFKEYITDKKDPSYWRAESDLLFLEEDPFQNYIHREEDRLEDENFDENEEEFNDQELYPYGEAIHEGEEHEFVPGHVDDGGGGLSMRSDLSDYGIEELDRSYTFDGVSKNLKTLRIFSQSNHLEYTDVVNLTAYAEAARGTGLNFDIGKSTYDGSYTRLYISTGMDYKGDPSIAFDRSKLKRSELYPDTYPDRFHMEALNQINLLFVIDGIEREMHGFVVGGELYFSPVDLGLAFKNRIHVGFDNNDEIQISSNKSDIYVPSVSEVKEEFKKYDYTLVHIWNPGLSWSRSSVYDVNDYYNVLQDRSEKINVLGFIDESYNYTKDELKELFKHTENKDFSYKNYGIDENIAAYLRLLNGGSYEGLPGLFFADRNGNILGHDFYHYFDIYGKNEARDLGLSESDFLQNHFGYGEDLDYGMYNKIKSNVYEDFIDLALKDGIREVKENYGRYVLQNIYAYYNIDGNDVKIRTIKLDGGEGTVFKTENLVNLYDLASKSRDSKNKFNLDVIYNEDGSIANIIKVTRGQNYNGQRPTTLRNSTLRNSSSKEEFIKVEVDGKKFEMPILRVNGEIFVNPNEFMNALGFEVLNPKSKVVEKDSKDNPIKVPAKAIKLDKKSDSDKKSNTKSNPKTGVGSVSSAIAMASIAAIALKKTKKY